MWTAIITAALTILTPLLIYFVKQWISGQDTKSQAWNSFLNMIGLHKNDGQDSAAKKQDVQNQVDDLNKPDAPK